MPSPPPPDAPQLPPAPRGDGPGAPRVVPWVAFGGAVGVIAAAVIALAAWGRADDTQVATVRLVAVSVTTVLFGVVVGLAVGQFIRIAGIVRAWRPTLPTVLDAPVPSTNGHGSADGGARPVVANGAVMAVLATLGAVLTGPVVVPLLPAPIVLAVGALALDERVWVRVVATAGLFIAALSLAGFLVQALLSGGVEGPVFLAAIVLVGVVCFLTARRVHPTR